MDPSFYEVGHPDPSTNRAMDIGNDHASAQGTVTPVPIKPTSAAGVYQGRALRDLQEYTSLYIDSNQEPSRMKSPASGSNILLQVASTSKHPLEADADGMIPLIFDASALTDCLFSPSYAKTKEVGNTGGPSKASRRKRASLESRTDFSKFFADNFPTQRITLRACHKDTFYCPAISPICESTFSIAEKAPEERNTILAGERSKEVATARKGPL